MGTEKTTTIDFINKQLGLEQKVENKFTGLNDAMREHHEVFGHELPPLPREPVLSIFYTPSNEQHDIMNSIFSANEVSLSNTLMIISLKLVIWFISIPLERSILSCLTFISSFCLAICLTMSSLMPSSYSLGCSRNLSSLRFSISMCHHKLWDTPKIPLAFVAL